MLTEDKNKSLEHVEITSIESISEIKRSYHIENEVVKIGGCQKCLRFIYDYYIYYV